MPPSVLCPQQSWVWDGSLKHCKRRGRVMPRTGPINQLLQPAERMGPSSIVGSHTSSARSNFMRPLAVSAKPVPKNQVFGSILRRETQRDSSCRSRPVQTRIPMANLTRENEQCHRKIRDCRSGGWRSGESGSRGFLSESGGSRNRGFTRRGRSSQDTSAGPCDSQRPSQIPRSSARCRWCATCPASAGRSARVDEPTARSGWNTTPGRSR